MRTPISFTRFASLACSSAPSPGIVGKSDQSPSGQGLPEAIFTAPGSSQKSSSFAQSIFGSAALPFASAASSCAFFSASRAFWRAFS